ncbi:MAG: ribose transport system ATP-binding protein [Planctomycetota bacterium]|jgi:ribose transport system ATP-binding protein
MTQSGPVRLRMRGVTKSFGPVAALSGVDIEVHAGEVHALLGENGAGKSTLMKVLSGAHASDGGEMQLDGVPYAPNGPSAARERGVAMIYQELNLAPDLTVEENIVLGSEPRTSLGRVDRKARRAIASAALEQLGQGAPPPTARVGDLSPAARQLVEVARALAADARVIIFDEPTSSLGRADAQRLFERVADLAEGGVAVIWISHFLEEIEQVAQAFTVLRDGQTVGHGRVAETTSDDWVALMAGRKVEELFPSVPHTLGEVLLELKSLSAKPLPADVSLELHRGEIFGIAGLVGAGRTELLRALFALEPITAGEVRLAGVSAPAKTPRARLNQGMGLLSEDRKGEGLAQNLSIATNLCLSHPSPVTRMGLLSPRAMADATAHWAERLGLVYHSSKQAMDQLSGGNQQKVAIARLLHHDCDLLLFDEPTRGIDVGAKVEVYRLMGELAAAGKAILVVSSYNPELLGVCDRIAVMHRGTLGPARIAADWTDHELLEAAARGAAPAHA